MPVLRGGIFSTALINRELLRGSRDTSRSDPGG